MSIGFVPRIPVSCVPGISTTQVRVPSRWSSSSTLIVPGVPPTSGYSAAIETSHPSAPRDLGDVVDRLAALYPEVGGTSGTIRVEELDHLDGTRTWVVEIPGTQDTGIRGTNPMDMATNLRLMAGLPTVSYT